MWRAPPRFGAQTSAWSQWKARMKREGRMGRCALGSSNQVIPTDIRAAAPKDTTGGRTVEHRIAVRWPGLAHLTTASVLRLPRGSRLRRAMLERSARAGYEA